MMTGGCATASGTTRFESRLHEFRAGGFYRSAQRWRVSSLGLGTYLGAIDERTDCAYAEAAAAAIRGGINFLDTAINYRLQRSERSLARALHDVFRRGFNRDEIVVCTKAGFLIPGAVPEGLAEAGVVGGMHSMAPRFLAGQLELSRQNLGLDTIDVLYLHNPETQLDFVPREEFEARLERAFGALEEEVSRKTIQYYGAATWDGFRRPPEERNALSLPRMIEIARRAGGESHHFRFIQLPYNLAMTEAYTEPWQEVEGGLRNLLETAAEYGVTVVASATLLQARLVRGLPAELAAALPGPSTDALRAIQFTRSAPGIAVALVGMSSAAHVRENLGIARIPPASAGDYRNLFQPVS